MFNPAAIISKMLPIFNENILILFDVRKNENRGHNRYTGGKLKSTTIIMPLYIIYCVLYPRQPRLYDTHRIYIIYLDRNNM